MNKKLILGLLTITLVSACGFEPLYVQRDTSSSWYFGGKTDTSITAEMSKVKIDPIADRFGQQLRNNLLDLVTPRGMPKNPQYRLQVRLLSRNVVQQAMRRDIRRPWRRRRPKPTRPKSLPMTLRCVWALIFTLS